MNASTIPPVTEIRGLLEKLGHAQVHELARASGVPFTTIWKVRSGETGNPGIETVRKWMPHLKLVEAKAA